MKTPILEAAHLNEPHILKEPLPEQPESAKALFTDAQVGWATFLGNPVAGGVLLALNYRRLNKTRAALIALISSWISAALLAFIILYLPHSGANLLYVFQAVIAVYVAKLLQGTALKSHFAGGGRRASNWTTVGIGVSGFILQLVVWFAVVALNPELFSPRVDIAPGETVFYMDSATKQEAASLGEALKQLGYFDGKTPASVCLSKDREQIAILVPIPDGWDDPQVVKDFTQLGRTLSDSLGGLPLHIRLTDADWTVKKDIEIK